MFTLFSIKLIIIFYNNIHYDFLNLSINNYSLNFFWWISNLKLFTLFKFSFLQHCFLSLIIISFLLTLSFILTKNSYIKHIEKLTPYECGFEPYEDARHLIGINFFLIALLFLIFDIELLFIYPLILSFTFLTNLGFFFLIDFLIELILAYIYIYISPDFNSFFLTKHIK